MYHSPHGVAGELSGRGLIPSRSRSCDVLGTRRECMSDRNPDSHGRNDAFSFSGMGGAGRVADRCTAIESVMNQT